MIFTVSTKVFVTSYLTDLNIPNESSLTVFLMIRHLVNASGATVSLVKVLLPSQTQLLIMVFLLALLIYGSSNVLPIFLRVLK